MSLLSVVTRIRSRVSLLSAKCVKWDLNYIKVRIKLGGCDKKMSPNCVNYADWLHLLQTYSQLLWVLNILINDTSSNSKSKHMEWSSCKCRQGSVASPDDFIAGTTYWGPPTVLRRLLSCLQDRAAVLHGRRLDRLLVLGHDSAGFVWAIAVGEIRVSDPRRATGGAWAACCCGCSLGAWARGTKWIVCDFE